jgi:HPt (histidine-containing phosphotransfer) domain-containing protein
MAVPKKKKDDKPSVATYADHEVIHPPHKLRKAVVKMLATDKADDPIARAEQALSQLSSEFGAWMVSECERLDTARHQVKAVGFNKETRDALFHAAHDIKGEAATFGFPDVAASAESLCRLIEHTPDATRIPLALVDQHVDAIRAIIRESAEADVTALADALTRTLRDVTDEFLASENRDRPDVLEGILAPSLAPEQSF